MAPGHRRSPSSAPLRTSLCPSTALPTKTDTCQCLQVAARQGSCSAPDRASSRLLLQLCGQLCPGPSRHCQRSTVESLSSGAGASSWIRTCELGCQVPPWPNGQGVGPLIRRLRAQVPQGVETDRGKLLGRQHSSSRIRRTGRTVISTLADLDCVPRPRAPRTVCCLTPVRPLTFPRRNAALARTSSGCQPVS